MSTLKHLRCPACGQTHADMGEWATRPHKTHLCVASPMGLGCGHTWADEEASVGVPYPQGSAPLHMPRAQVPAAVSLLVSQLGHRQPENERGRDSGQLPHYGGGVG